MLLATLYVPWYSKPGRRGDFATMPPRPHATLEGSGYKREHEQWTRIWPALQALPGLQRFNLWLDHIEDHPWDTVCEREILQGLSDIMPSLKSRNVRVTVNLPRLPSEALMAPFTDEESFTDEEYFLNKPPEFELQRRTRLPWIALSLGPIYPDIVGWAENRENGSIPAGFEGGQSVLVEQVWTNFAMMGYSVYCEEFRNHPVLGDFYDDGFQSQWDCI
ncbi:hypothetical protein CSUB01_10441 [Colletotrichum sublineola]|uniref:Uncharacterized protein n=1 Tax=Colletotrichum sublineola TaxID=1173701 RepID=A0A066X1Y6_COLSU|nr:hypothetical protein CSUB01_10441 [Colletotrichum sublineola]